MAIVVENSLGKTLDNLNHCWFKGDKINQKDRRAAARFIAERQGQPGSYHGMFAPTKLDLKRGFTFYSGEGITSGAGTAHTISEEALMALKRLDAGTKQSDQAIAAAHDALANVLAESNSEPGFHCCGPCTVAMWRNLAVGGYPKAEKIIRAGIRQLGELQDGKGRWKRFPFYYTLLALSELDIPPARRELKYAQPAIERALKTKHKHRTYGPRRKAILERVAE
jgi:hypothetical protein